MGKARRKMNSNVTTITAYDPGKVIGIARGSFTDKEPLSILKAWAIPYPNFLEWGQNPVEDYGEFWSDIIVSEIFTARTDNEFVPDLTSVRVEGILDLAYGPNRVVWRPRTKKEQVPDKVLKDHGLWKTGKDVSWEDGRDVNDAIIHMLGHVAFDLRHKPTLRKYFMPNYGKVELRGAV